MPASASRRRNRFGDAFRSRVTYHRDVAAERKELKRQAFADRRERLAIKKLEAQERAAAAKIATADRKIAAAESKIETATTKASRSASRSSGGISEAELERIKAHMESEIAKQEDLKRVALAKVGNPSWGYGIYQGRGFATRQLAHFQSRTAAETYARSAGLTGYSIKRAFDKTGRENSTGRTTAGNPCGQHDRGLSRNSALEFSTEYHLGYNLGQADRQSARLRKTLDELHATFNANFAPGAMASWESFEQAYQAGYGGQMGAAAPNPESLYLIADKKTGKTIRRGLTQSQAQQYSGNHPGTYWTHDEESTRQLRKMERLKPTNRPNPEGDGSEEYQQALRTAELFHGRPVKEQIEVEESIRTHDWYVSIGPLIKLIIKPVTKKPKARVPLPFHQSEAGQVQLFTSPDGTQFYLRGGDQELDLKAFGMGQGSAWFRDHMLIGEAVEITYRDRKKFHSFKLTEYYHKLGEQTRVKPTLVYNSLAKKLSIIGGQYRIEMEDLVDGMSPGIVN